MATRFLREYKDVEIPMTLLDYMKIHKQNGHFKTEDGRPGRFRAISMKMGGDTAIASFYIEDTELMKLMRE
jgi:hypothetical protein